MRALALGLALLGGAALAEDGDALRGAEIYMNSCATCHGAEATGGGPMAAMLILQPPALTTLALANDGVFPVLRVVMRIDGRDPLVAHGSPMPVWGGYFEEAGTPATLRIETGQEITTTQAIADLVAYLEAVQEE